MVFLIVLLSPTHPSCWSVHSAAGSPTGHPQAWLGSLHVLQRKPIILWPSTSHMSRWHCLCTSPVSLLACKPLSVRDWVSLFHWYIPDAQHSAWHVASVWLHELMGLIIHLTLTTCPLSAFLGEDGVSRVVCADVWLWIWPTCSTALYTMITEITLLLPAPQPPGFADFKWKLIWKEMA